MDETSETRQAALAYVESLENRDWPRLTTLLSDDVVYEMPQTRERIRGRHAFLRFNTDYPGDWHLRVRRLIADGRAAALWLDFDEHGLISRITDHWPEPYEPPPGREHLVERWSA